MGPLIGALADALGPQLESPFALFGHSMGGLVAFELARELRRRGARAPEHLYVAGRLAPEAPPTRPLVHDLPDATMIDVMQRRYRAIPRAVLDEPEFLALLLPTLRADMSVIETYTYQAEAPLDVPLTIFGGVDDEGVPLAGLEAWRAHTTKSVAIHAVAGGHFFLSTNEKAFLPLLASALAPRQRAEHEDAVGLDAPR
jgi:medium-chain acyl-[acyl-carrier-protein] hydrolase